MRLIGQLLLLALLAAAIAWGWRHAASLLPGGERAVADQRLERARVAVAYRLDGERWTDFAIAPGDRRLRLLTNAELPAGLSPAPEEEYPYAVAWRLVDGEGRVLDEGVYHQRAGLSLFDDPVSGERLPRAFYYPADRQPGDGRGWVYHLGGFDGAARLRLRLAEGAAPLVGVVARVYRREAVAEHKLAYRWQRMGEERRERLARASVYSGELLRDEEKVRLLAGRWLPVGPTGAAGRDYRRVRLYVMEAYEGLPHDTPIPPAGVSVGPGFHGVVPIPAEGGRLHLRWRPVTEGEEASGELAFHWFGHPASRQRRWRQSWTGEGEWHGELEAGVVELISPLALAARAWLESADGRRREITPEPRYLRLYGGGETLRYPFGPGEAGPLRVDLRRRLDGGGEGVARYRVVDGEGRALLEGALGALDQAGRYERFTDQGEGPLSEPARYHFNLPAGAAELRVETPAGVYLAVYRRPPGLATLAVLPEPAEGELEIPAWFPRRPADHHLLLGRGAAPLIQFQPRPPEVDPEILAGRYRWESYLPEGRWRGRHLLLPRGEEAVARVGSEGGAFHPVPAGGERVAKFVGTGGRVRPRLLFLREKGGSMTVTIRLDGGPWLETRVGARSGLLALPAVAAGEHRLRIESEGEARFYLDGIEGAGAGYLRQLALGLDDRPLRFPYRKESAGEELLSLRFHGPEGGGEGQRLRLRIEGLPEREGGPYGQWTLAERHYLLRPAVGEPVPLIGGDRRVDAGTRLIIPFGEDLPPGRYRLELSLDEGPGGYLELTRTRPGLAPRRQWTRE